MELSLVIVLLCALGSTDCWEVGTPVVGKYFGNEVDIFSDAALINYMTTATFSIIERNKLLTASGDPGFTLPNEVYLRFVDGSEMKNEITKMEQREPYIFEITLKNDVPSKKCIAPIFTQLNLETIYGKRALLYNQVDGDTGNDLLRIGVTYKGTHPVLYIKRLPSMSLPPQGKSLFVEDNLVGLFLGASPIELLFAFTSYYTFPQRNDHDTIP